MSRSDPPEAFEEPWQAQTFALTLYLHDAGIFTWDQWTRALTNALESAAAHGAATDGSDYYEAWLKALETLALELGLADLGALCDLKIAWAEAYEHTPHGHPVTLRREPTAPRSV